MKELEKFSKVIEQMTAPVGQISNALNEFVTPIIQRYNEVAIPIFSRIDEFTKACEPFFCQLYAFAEKTVEAAQRWQIERKQDVTFMADNGWYPNWFTFFYSLKKEEMSVDELMSSHLNDNWNIITEKILTLCPNRIAILENAFNLHQSGNYIAAIPLFLAQADGICNESIKRFLFAGDPPGGKIKQLIDDGKVEIDMFTGVFLEPFKLKNHYKVGISKANRNKKVPNRSGILHGHREHLDYGNKINSLKCFSLLAFIVYTTKEIMNETE